METKKQIFAPPTATSVQGRKRYGRWLCLLLLLMMFMPAMAQSNAQRDIITFTNGAVSPDDPNIYVIDLGDRPLPRENDGYEDNFTVTLRRPLGASATHEATIQLKNLVTNGVETVTFAPGDVEKEAHLEFRLEPHYEPVLDEDGIITDVNEWMPTYWSGNIPCIYSVVNTSYADAEYQVLIVKINRTGADEPRQCTYETKLETLQNLQGFDRAFHELTRWGEYVLFRFMLNVPVEVTPDCRYVTDARYVDHTSLGPNVDDFGMAKSREVELKPINVGSICDEVWYLYHPTDDEYLHSYHISTDITSYDNLIPHSSKVIGYPVLEAGPFKVANPAENAVKYMFFSREDLPERNSQYYVQGIRQVFAPKFSNISLDKDSYLSGETMILTATMDNWQFVKRVHQNDFMSTFGVTLNGAMQVEPRRVSFDEQTGLVTYYITAPTVSTTSTVHVEFGPIMLKDFINEQGWDDAKYTVYAPKEGLLDVTVSSTPAPTIPTEQILFSGLPENNSSIALDILDNGNFWNMYQPRYREKEYTLAYTTVPANATDAHDVEFSSDHYIETTDNFSNEAEGMAHLHTGDNAGTVKLKVNLTGNENISTTNTYYVSTSIPQGLSNNCSYQLGTTFPKLQFLVKNSYNNMVVKDDKVTVHYTHANGTQWTEEYQYSKLKKAYKGIEDITYVDLPFGFTDEHPEDITRISQTVISANVVMQIPGVADGQFLDLVCPVTLTPELKSISFGDYREIEAHSNAQHPVTLTSEVMYLPRIGFTVGYEIPELNLRETYNNLTDGDNVPEWLELQEFENYCTANITVKSFPNASTSKYHFYTLAQRSYNPNEVMIREMTTVATLKSVDFEDHIKYLVNGKPAVGNLSFDNMAHGNRFMSWFKNKGFIRRIMVSDIGVADSLRVLLKETAAHIAISDDYFDGAEVTLKCGEDTIQHLTKYNGDFTFMPPTDGKTYTVDVYFPDYGRRYTNTFRSHKLENIYNMSIFTTPIYWHVWPILEFAGGTVDYSTFGQAHAFQVFGDLYNEDRSKFYLKIKRGLTSNPASAPIRVHIKDVENNLFRPVEFKKSSKPELKQSSYSAFFDAESSWENKLKSNYDNFTLGFTLSDITIDLDKVTAGSTFVDLVDSLGKPITNATINYACADSLMNIKGQAGTTGYDDLLEGYQISTDPNQYVEFIEVVAPGYDTTLCAMYLRDFDYSSTLSQRSVRRQAIVLHEGSGRISNLTLETPIRDGNLENDTLVATINYDDLLMLVPGQKLNFSPTADYKNVIKTMNDGKFGIDGWSGKKYAHLTGNVSYEDEFDVSQFRLKNDTLNLAPQSYKLITKQEFTTFSTNYCVFDFDLTDHIPVDQSLNATLKEGDETVAELPLLHNHAVDLTVLNAENKVEMPSNQPNVNEADDGVSANGYNMDKDNGGAAFDNFNFQMPDVLPFTVNIERNGDRFMVRAICERNFIPGGKVMDAIEQLDNLKYFDEQYQACVDAVKSAKPADDDFFDDIPRFPSAFCGIKGYLTGVGTVNQETGKLEITFHDGGITFEASASASATASFGVGGFGVSVDAKLATTLALVNANALHGDYASLPRLDFVLDNQCRLKLCAWAYAGIDLWIAKAVVGVRGGACMDLRTRLVLPTYGEEAKAGLSASFRAAMEAYSELRFLFWTKKWSKKLLDASVQYLEPNDLSNPLHPDNLENVDFDITTKNVTRTYKRLKRKYVRDMGNPIIGNVSGMARPTYLMGGNSLVFNHLNKPKDYNDDRLMVYSAGNSQTLVNQNNWFNAPMYDFSVAKGGGTQMVAFEQVKDEINKENLEAMTEEAQTKEISENTNIYATVFNGEGWTQPDNLTEEAYGMATVNPVIAIQNDGKAVAVWQQGQAKFNDSGERYIDGSMMLKRYDGESWGNPIEIKRLNRRSVPTDYQVSMKEDSILVMMTLQQDVDNQNKQPSITYVSIDPKNKVRERYTMSEGSKPQMVHVNGTNLVGYLSRQTDGRDVTLCTVNMKGEPTGKVSGSLGMQRRMVNDFRLIVDEEATGLDDISLLWSQTDQETTTDTTTEAVNVDFKNRIYTSKLCSHDKLLYFSTPIQVATINDTVNLVSMDGYLNGLDMKVAFCVAGKDEGAWVIENNNVVFKDTIDYKVNYNSHDVRNKNFVPLTFTVANNGFNPINTLHVQLGDTTYVHEVMLMPQEIIELTDNYPVKDNFDGSINYQMWADFTPANSNSLKVRRMAAARPHRIMRSGTEDNIRQVDMALKVLSKRINAEGKTVIVAEVNNASLLPISNNMSVKVGLYTSPLATVKATGTTDVTLSYSDLYDATNKVNKTKIVALTADAPDFDQTLYLFTTPMEGDKAVADMQPSNNILPLNIKGKYILGDANGDGQVNIADVTAIINHINGNTPESFVEKAANVNRDDSINIADVTGVINIINRK